MKKFLIVGLGNIGDKYLETRHNIGFKILDEVAEEHKVSFETEKLGDVATFRFKGRTFFLLKPNTFMNLSGKAVKYWMQKEKIAIDNILVVTDDLNIDFGTIRVKAKGSDGGHNGLKDIQEKLGTNKYPRFRFGVGANYAKGRQVDYVLGDWNKEEISQLIERLPIAAKVVVSFGTVGLANTMNTYNGK
ncbi:aminoacyl-tRNA hydrolase [uncultured Polaribacter sp.]|uniref:aminoacyl-tRNA hydrolase n=1 Tax=uncultured Polaribacter sp. TaxID=174711 RepID=UPI00261A1E30|nr:aminoacyl-tRNA hydrolase [uncultured Polaribacter sp.]